MVLWPFPARIATPTPVGNRRGRFPNSVMTTHDIRFAACMKKSHANNVTPAWSSTAPAHIARIATRTFIVVSSAPTAKTAIRSKAGRCPSMPSAIIRTAFHSLGRTPSLTAKVATRARPSDSSKAYPRTAIAAMSRTFKRRSSIMPGLASRRPASLVTPWIRGLARSLII